MVQPPQDQEGTESVQWYSGFFLARFAPRCVRLGKPIHTVSSPLSVPTTVHTSATRAWTLFGDYGTARNDRHMADLVVGA
jgi:hypothetical protein